MNKLASLLLLCVAVTMSFTACEGEKAPAREFNPNKPGTDSGTTELSNPEIFTATPKSDIALFESIPEFTNEFDNGDPLSSWEIVDEKYQSWIFKSEQTNIVNNMLELQMKIIGEPATGKNGDPVYFQSGMLRSKNPIERYGYFEARIKGADAWQGVCPAFWLYTLPIPNAVYTPNEVTYNEIDIVELQQIPSDKRMMASNLHVGIADASGKPVTKKAGKYTKMGQSEFPVNFDSEDDYHIYAVENRPDSVVFYIDNKRTASKPNYFWHMKDRMFVTLSMGVRTPFEIYNDTGARLGVDPSEMVNSDGTPNTDMVGNKFIEGKFPTTMQIDYIRAYTRKDGYDRFRNNEREWNENEFKNK